MAELKRLPRSKVLDAPYMEVRQSAALASCRPTRQPVQDEPARRLPTRRFPMDRRKFIALGSIASTLAVPAIGRAATMGGADTKLPNLVFTEQDPGHWGALEKLHVPQTETMGDTLKVTTPHPMSEPHYIVSHTVVLEGGKFLSRKTFNWKDKPVSEHKLPMGYKGRIYVTSTCNLHDFWVKEIDI
jgi:superoxide reductase